MRSTRVPSGARMFKPLAGWLFAVLLLLTWQVWTSQAHSIYFPTPLDVLHGTYERWFSAGAPTFLTHNFAVDVVPSLERLAIGLAIAVVVGVALGVALGRNRVVAEIFEPLLHFMRALPGPVLIPLALVVVGSGTSMRVGIISFGAVWPVLFNTYSAVKKVPAGWISAARIARLGRPATLFRVIIPAASTGIFAGVRVATGIGIILLVASELVAASNGIGFGLTQSQRSFEFEAMWTFIVALSVLGYLANLMLSGVERLLLNWNRSLRRNDERGTGSV